jgi:hypothetical protein
MSWVEEVLAEELIVTVPQDRSQRPVNLETGERVELIWKGPEELRALPAELIAVEKAPQPRWRLRRVGPASRGQRRAAVRAPITLSVQIAKSGLALSGVTTDLSEGGMKCVLEESASDRAGQASPAGQAHTPADQADTDGAVAAEAAGAEAAAGL